MGTHDLREGSAWDGASEASQVQKQEIRQECGDGSQNVQSQGETERIGNLEGEMESRVVSHYGHAREVLEDTFSPSAEQQDLGVETELEAVESSLDQVNNQDSSIDILQVITNHGEQASASSKRKASQSIST